MSIAKHFVSCDWGTTSLRLRWIGPGGEVAREVRAACGCKLLFESARERTMAPAVLYQETMLKELEAFDDLAANVGSQVPLVISGMASSTIGWQETPYLKSPLKLDGSNLRFLEIVWQGPNWLGRTFLISGVAIRQEIMRGEETEAIGLLASRPGFQGTLVLPGTHSKHLQVEGAEVTGIATFMTGELFELMARHSILKASIELDERSPGWAFEDGVREALQNGVTRSLFRVRTRAVLDQADARENRHFLSGLLIGGEMAELLQGRIEGDVLLAGAPHLRDLYARALRVVSEPELVWSTPADEELDGAVARAHALFLGSHA